VRLDFFDANAFVGLPINGCYRPAVGASELMDGLAPTGIGRALVWHIAQHDYSPQVGNDLLSEAIRGLSQLYGCWTILPPQTGEVITYGFFKQMKANRIFALRAFPERHRYILNRLVFGQFLEELVARRIPLILSTERGVSWDAIYRLLADVPDLTCILCDLGCWNLNRYTWPLLEEYPNVYLETSFISIQAGGLEATVEKFGAERLVFGSAFPIRYPDAAALQLLRAEISDEDKRRVASGNLERLLSEVEL